MAQMGIKNESNGEIITPSAFTKEQWDDFIKDLFYSEPEHKPGIVHGSFNACLIIQNWAWAEEQLCIIPF